MEKLVRQKSLDVPDPKVGGPGPLVLVPDQNGLKNAVSPTRKAPEHNPGHCLFEVEDISTIPPDTAHPSQRTVTAQELARLRISDSE